MSSAQIKEILKNQIDEADDRLLKMIYAMVDAYHESDTAFSYDEKGNPTSAKDMRKRLEGVVNNIKNGKGISLEELQKESEKWTKPTK